MNNTAEKPALAAKYRISSIPAMNLESPKKKFVWSKITGLSNSFLID